MHYLTFGIDLFAQYPLHHVFYAAAKFEVAPSNSLGVHVDAFPYGPFLNTDFYLSYIFSFSTAYSIIIVNGDRRYLTIRCRQYLTFESRSHIM